MVWVNTYFDRDATAPWGGVKQSGNGRDKCLEALHQYSQTKSVWIISAAEPQKEDAMKICIIENGLTPEQLRDQHGTYPQMARNWLGPALPEATFTTISVVGARPCPEDPADYDGYLLTGSKHGVYENLPWMLDVQRFLNRLAEARIPMFGICFGHQIMAEPLAARCANPTRAWPPDRSPIISVILASPLRTSWSSIRIRSRFCHPRPARPGQ